MKKKIIVVFLSIITGLILSLFAMPKLSFEVHSGEMLNVYILQAGIYENYNNALKKNKVVEGFILEDNNKYLVIKGASLSKSGIEKIKKQLKEEYYLKTISIYSTNREKIENYEMILSNTIDPDTILYIGKRISSLVATK